MTVPSLNDVFQSVNTPPMNTNVIKKEEEQVKQISEELLLFILEDIHSCSVYSGHCHLLMSFMDSVIHR